jgi:hypothetical protein
MRDIHCSVVDDFLEKINKNKDYHFLEKNRDKK